MVYWSRRCIFIGILCAMSGLAFTDKVSEVTCSTDGAACNGITNSICKSTTCACSTGYSEDQNGGSTCVQVFGTVCHGNDPCTGLEHSVCLNGKCACADNYEEKNAVCTLTVSGITCSAQGAECNKIANAECDTTKCKCSDGFVMNVDVCAPENTVLATGCQGSNTCTGLEHSVCLNGRCACADNYEEKNAVCTLTVNGITCSAQGTECQKIANAECEATKCKCSDGFVMNVDVCAPENPVLGTGCQGSNTCTGLEHSLCLNGKCACAENYEEKNAVCTLTVSGITCSAQGTECDKIANAECEATKCKCSDGFVMNVDVCAPKNTAATLKIGAATLVLFAILTVLQITG